MSKCKKNIEKIINFVEKHEKLIFGFLVLLFSIIYFSTYFFTTIPISEGWGQYYVDLVNSGKVPYKDFYYYLPPYNLVFDWVLWKFAFGHIMLYCFYRFIERMLMIYLLYYLLCKVVKPKYACLGLCAGIAMFGAVTYDIIGDYNQTSFLLAVIVTIFYCNYMKLFETDNKKQYLWLFLAGLFIGLSFLLKQPLFLAECLLFFPIITAHFIIKHKKNYFKSLLISVLGISIPILITVIILAANGALKNFLEQVYFGSTNKGSLFEIITTIVRTCVHYKYVLYASFVSYLVIRYKEKQNSKFNKDTLMIYVFMLLFSTYIIANGRIDTLNKFISSRYGLASILGLALIVLIDKYTKNKLKNHDTFMCIIYVMYFLILMIGLVIKPVSAIVVFVKTASYGLLDDICIVSTCACIIIIGYLIYIQVKNKKIDNKLLIWEFILIGSLIYEYAMQMGANNIHTMGCVMIISSLFALVFQYLGKENKTIKYVMVTLIAFICVSSVSQKIVNAYSWWGWSEERLTPEKKYSINVPGLEGYRTSQNTKNMYEEMYKVVKENTNKKSVIYGFPYVEIFNVLLHNTNMNTFVPVPFYDVVADKYAKEDAIRLSKNPPDIVIWLDIPGCMEAHEKIYRDNQPLGQRDIQTWFSDAVRNKKYILIGQYDNIYIYKLKNKTKVKYTYFKDENAVNQTIIQ